MDDRWRLGVGEEIRQIGGILPHYILGNKPPTEEEVDAHFI